MKFEMSKDTKLSVIVGLTAFLVIVFVLCIGIESARSSRTSKKQDELLDIEIDTKRRVNKAVREGRINALLIGIGTEDKIATEKLDNNTPDETPNEERLTIEEWQEKLGFQIHDPDGFDRTDTKLYERKFTQAQFMAGAERSTMLGKDILIYKKLCNKNPNAVPETPDEEMPSEPSEYDQIMAIINDAYKAPELKDELLDEFDVQTFIVGGRIMSGWVIQVFGEEFYRIIDDSIDIVYPDKPALLKLLYIGHSGTKEEVFATAIQIDDYSKFLEDAKNKGLELKSNLPDRSFISIDVPVASIPEDDGSQEFIENVTQGGNYAPPIPADGILTALSDHIPHEEKMIEEVIAPELEPAEDNNIRAPFDGEIVEIREGRFTIKANDKGMKISFDCDIFKVALHDKVVKNQILGQNII